MLVGTLKCLHSNLFVCLHVFVFDHQQMIYYKSVATANATLFTTYLLILSYQLT